eukprot:14730_1
MKVEGVVLFNDRYWAECTQNIDSSIENGEIDRLHKVLVELHLRTTRKETRGGKIYDGGQHYASILNKRQYPIIYKIIHALLKSSEIVDKRALLVYLRVFSKYITSATDEPRPWLDPRSNNGTIECIHIDDPKPRSTIDISADRASDSFHAGPFVKSESLPKSARNSQEPISACSGDEPVCDELSFGPNTSHQSPTVPVVSSQRITNDPINGAVSSHNAPGQSISTQVVSSHGDEPQSLSSQPVPNNDVSNREISNYSSFSQSSPTPVIQTPPIDPVFNVSIRPSIADTAASSSCGSDELKDSQDESNLNSTASVPSSDPQSLSDRMPETHSESNRSLKRSACSQLNSESKRRKSDESRPSSDPTSSAF